MLSHVRDNVRLKTEIKIRRNLEKTGDASQIWTSLYQIEQQTLHVQDTMYLFYLTVTKSSIIYKEPVISNLPAGGPEHRRIHHSISYSGRWHKPHRSVTVQLALSVCADPFPLWVGVCAILIRKHSTDTPCWLVGVWPACVGQSYLQCTPNVLLLHSNIQFVTSFTSPTVTVQIITNKYSICWKSMQKKHTAAKAKRIIFLLHRLCSRQEIEATSTQNIMFVPLLHRGY